MSCALSVHDCQRQLEKWYNAFHKNDPVPRFRFSRQRRYREANRTSFTYSKRLSASMWLSAHSKHQLHFCRIKIRSIRPAIYSCHPHCIAFHTRLYTAITIIVDVIIIISLHLSSLFTALSLRPWTNIYVQHDMYAYIFKHSEVSARPPIDVMPFAYLSHLWQPLQIR